MDFSFIPTSLSGGDNPPGIISPSPNDEEELSIDFMPNRDPPLLCHWPPHDDIDEGVVKNREDMSEIDAMLGVVRCVLRRIPFKLRQL